MALVFLLPKVPHETQLGVMNKFSFKIEGPQAAEAMQLIADLLVALQDQEDIKADLVKVSNDIDEMKKLLEKIVSGSKKKV